MASAFADCVDCGVPVRVQLSETTLPLFQYGSGAPALVVPEGFVVRCEADTAAFAVAQVKAKAAAKAEAEAKAEAKAAAEAKAEKAPEPVAKAGRK